MESTDRLVPVHTRADILPSYRATPVETLLVSHALGREMPPAPTAEMVVVTCIDPRIELLMPEDFAFVVRTAGATVGPVLFNVAFALSTPGVDAVAVIGHSDCRMVGVHDARAAFLEGMAEISTLDPSDRERIFEAGAKSFGCRDGVQHVLAQCHTIRRALDRVLIAPLYLDVETGDLSQITEG